MNSEHSVRSSDLNNIDPSGFFTAQKLAPGDQARDTTLMVDDVQRDYSQLFGGGGGGGTEESCFDRAEDDDKFEEEQQNHLSGGRVGPLHTATATNNNKGSSGNSDIRRQSQYQTQNLHQEFLQKASLLQDMRENDLNNLFSNSFDECGSSFDLLPQRTSKSSTRMRQNGANKNTNTAAQFQLAQGGPHGHLEGASNSSAIGLMNQKPGGFAGYMRSQQPQQDNYQQKILSQIQRANTMSSFDMNQKQQQQDLSNRSFNLITPGGQSIMNNSYAVNQYMQSGPTATGGVKLNTPSQNGCNTSSNNNNGSNANNFQQVMMSAGSAVNPRNGNTALNCTTVDPYAYLRWQQQKYKSCRSMLYNKNQKQATDHYMKQLKNQNNTPSHYPEQSKGNQTQKSYVRSSSSTGSALNTSATTLTANIKVLGEVKNPQCFIYLRFNDRKLTELKDVNLFKNLTELDISGNLLKDEISDLKQLNFLKKLNLSNNHIESMYPLPSNLEMLNLSYNQLKKLDDESTASLKNLTTLDMSNNGIESLEGIQNLKRLRRLLLKNNQVQELSPLKDIISLVEIDLENNPVDSYKELLVIITNKKDILVINLKLSPLILTIQNYDQFSGELAKITEMQTEINIMKEKLKFFQNGTLYRSKKVYTRLRTMQLHSKRSSSNFSNGSSSCGRVGGGGGGGGGNFTTNPASSPLLGNLSATPNQHPTTTTQRNEDIDQLYEEILNDEEQIERKQNRIQKKKLQKQLGAQDAGEMSDEFDDDDLEDDESLYGDDQQVLSGEDDLENLQSYRNNHVQGPSDFLNESTADFNKEIKQINQEMREQLAAQDELHSLQSTQSIGTSLSKKNPISFKLDLSKCKPQQQDEEEKSDCDEDGQFEIPGLQYIKVTEDSFRQIPVKSNQVSVRNQAEKKQEQQQSQQINQQLQQQQQQLQQQQQPTVVTSLPTKVQQKQVVVPRLQLGVLSKGPSAQQSHKQLITSAKKQTTDAVKQIPKEDIELASAKKLNLTISNRKNIICINEECVKLKEELQRLKSKQTVEQDLTNRQLTSYKSIIEDIKKVVNYDSTATDDGLVSFISGIVDQNKELGEKKAELGLLVEELTQKCLNLENMKQKQQQISDNGDEVQKQQSLAKEAELVNKSTQQAQLIANLKDQLHKIQEMNQGLKNDIDLGGISKQFSIRGKELDFDSQKYSTEQAPFAYSTSNRTLPLVLNKTKSTQAQEVGSTSKVTKSEFFYHQQSSIDSSEKSSLGREEDPLSGVSAEIENIGRKTKQKLVSDSKKPLKRPQSVTQAVKKSNQLRKVAAGQKANANQNSSMQDFNEYGTVNSLKLDGVKLSQTMNKKVGIYIEKLKERNSSLQEKLNVPLNNSQSSSSQPKGKLRLKVTGNGDQSNQSMVLPDNIIPDLSNYRGYSTTQHAQSSSSKAQSHQTSSSAYQSSLKALTKTVKEPIQSNRGVYGDDQNKGDVQPTSTQRQLPNKIKFNQLLQQQNQTTNVSSDVANSTNTTTTNVPRQQYQLNLGAINDSLNYNSVKLDAGRAGITGTQGNSGAMICDKLANNYSFREAIAKANALKSGGAAYSNNSFNLRNQKNA